MDLSAEQRKVLLDSARHTICTTLGRRLAPMQVQDDPVLRQPAGCFVTLHARDTHRLRGCVGQLEGRDELLAVVRQSAANVLNDPRFQSFPVTLSELPELEIEITVIFPMRLAQSCLDFDLLNEGLYLTINERSGCFLPQVARETGWTREQLLARLCAEKLGLPQDAWKTSAAKLMKFNTMIVGPEPF